jgi:hypothetical protein
LKQDVAVLKNDDDDDVLDDVGVDAANGGVGDNIEWGWGDVGAVADSGIGVSDAREMWNIEGGAERDVVSLAGDEWTIEALGREGDRVRILLAMSISEEERERGGDGGDGEGGLEVE